MGIPCNDHVVYPHLNDGVLHKLVFANLHVKRDFLVICPLSAVDTEVIVIIRQTRCEVTKC